MGKRNKILQRKYDTKNENEMIFIFTEGEGSEPNYFTSKKKEIRKTNVHIEIIGLGDHTDSLVNFVLRFIKRCKIDLGDGSNECWVVFDKDSHEKFNEAIFVAEKNGINVAYSNECFEIWILLHFCYCDAALDRNQLFDKVNQLLKDNFGTPYTKGMNNLYDLISQNESQAIKSSKKLLSLHDGEGSYEKKNPSTKVHQLIERLNKL